MDRLEQERGPLEALLEALLASGNSERALLLAGALARFWWMRGYAAAGRARIQQALALPGGGDRARAAALIGAGSLAYAAGDFRAARAHCAAAQSLLGAAGQELDLAHVLDRAGMAARQLMELDEARQLHTWALDIQRLRGTPPGRALCLNNLAVVAFFQGELGEARRQHQAALALREQIGDLRGQASSLNNLGQVARFAGDLSSARAFTERGLALRLQLGDRWGVAGSQVNLAVVHALAGDISEAHACLRQAVAGFRGVADPLGICECLEAGAELARAEGRLTDAVTFCAAAELRRERLPAPLSPVHRRGVTGLLAEIDAAIGVDAYTAAWQRGRESGDAVLEWLG